MYLTVFFVGMVGFVVMIAMGSFHGHGMGGSHAGHVGHAVGHSVGHAGGHSVGHVRGAAPPGAKVGVKSAPGSSAGLSKMLVALSPIHLFGMAVGFGATGVLLHAALKGDWLVAAALLGGLCFDILAIKPMMNFLANFASRPSEGLAGSVLQEGEAVSGFDQSGRGIVRISIDGQYTQLLATLDQSEIEKGIRVIQGDKVIVVDVDTTKNSCRVTKELAS